MRTLGSGESSWPEWEYQLGTGCVSVSWHGREVSEADRQRWAWEDRARDARRIPVGFVAPPRVKKKRKR